MQTNTNIAKRLLTDCRRSGTGLPAFNYSDMWDLMAIVAAAGRMKVHVMAASNALVAEALGLDLCQAMVRTLGARSSVAIVNHLDHSSSVDLCIRAVEAGYPSVMIDGSHYPLEENIRMTREVVRYAHGKGAIVEGEIGRIGGEGSEGPGDRDQGAGDSAFLADVDEAVELVQKTSVDSLAVAIGTAHGFYAARPEIRFDRLAELAAAVDVPLVLHGGTGIPDEDIRRAIRLGITKVNVGTIIHTTYLANLRDELVRAGNRPYTLEVMHRVLPHVEEVIADRIRAINGRR